MDTVSALKSDGVKIPQLRMVYKSMLSASIPYSLSNWGLRMFLHRNLKYLISQTGYAGEGMIQYLSFYLIAGVWGAISSFVTTPLLKILISAHYAQSLNNYKYKYATIYESIFIETKFKENKKSLFKRLQIFYRYSGLIALRGCIQSMIILGTFDSINLYTGKKDQVKEKPKQFVTSENPLLSRLKRLGLFKSDVIENTKSSSNLK